MNDWTAKDFVEVEGVVRETVPRGEGRIGHASHWCENCGVGIYPSGWAWKEVCSGRWYCTMRCYHRRDEARESKLRPSPTLDEVFGSKKSHEKGSTT